MIKAKGFSQLRKRRVMSQVIFLLGFIIYPIFGQEYAIEQVTQYFIYGIFAMSLDIIWGYVGIFSFGHAVFFGLGGYFMTLVTKQMIPYITVFHSTYAGLIFGIGMPALFAVLLGYFLFYSRIAGPYFAILMLAIAVIFERIAVDWYYVGGFNGIFNIPPITLSIPGVFAYEITHPIMLYYVILGITVGSYIFCYRVVCSPFGSILSAIKDNEERVEFFGYNIPRYKIKIYAISAGIAGLAGALFAAVFSYVGPTIIGFVMSTEVLIWVILGGKGTLVGAMLGAILVRFLEAFLSDIMAYYWILLLAFIFIICVMFFPKGVFGYLFSED
ncbi:MAG: branched-chain amino acid ABC transporter permease [Desulfobacteraceae bacterium]|jgi:urea ABC transporter permease protein UrtC|nr:branched-chain amino acid ABC transporter permease [Desulfobacteraceae bacterium]